MKQINLSGKNIAILTFGTVISSIVVYFHPVITKALSNAYAKISYKVHKHRIDVQASSIKVPQIHDPQVPEIELKLLRITIRDSSIFNTLMKTIFKETAAFKYFLQQQANTLPSIDVIRAYPETKHQLASLKKLNLLLQDQREDVNKVNKDHPLYSLTEVIGLLANTEYQDTLNARCVKILIETETTAPKVAKILSTAVEAKILNNTEEAKIFSKDSAMYTLLANLLYPTSLMLYMMDKEKYIKARQVLIALEFHKLCASFIPNKTKEYKELSEIFSNFFETVDRLELEKEDFSKVVSALVPEEHKPINKDAFKLFSRFMTVNEDAKNNLEHICQMLEKMDAATIAYCANYISNRYLQNMIKVAGKEMSENWQTSLISGLIASIINDTGDKDLNIFTDDTANNLTLVGTASQWHQIILSQKLQVGLSACTLQLITTIMTSGEEFDTDQDKSFLGSESTANSLEAQEVQVIGYPAVVTGPTSLDSLEA